MRDGNEDSEVYESDGNIDSTDNDSSWRDGTSFGRAGMALTQSKLCPPWVVVVVVVVVTIGGKE